MRRATPFGIAFALIALVAMVAIREVPLRTTIERADEIAESRIAVSKATA